jgi:alkyl sulfatase BDS1-like metallo-beta-lactamase superfamily hydrolase
MPEGYPEGYVAAVNLIERLAPKTLVPGHGRIEKTTLASLKALPAVTVYLMAEVRRCVGEGYDLERTMAAVAMPESFRADPLVAGAFVASRGPYVNRLFKNYTGYYGSNPAHFVPAPARARSALIAEIAGGNDRLVATARRLAGEGEHQLALELLEMVTTNDPGHGEARLLKAEAFLALARAPERNWYQKAAYANAARKERALAGGPAPP